MKTPLHYACEYGHLKIVKYLISKGANIEAKDRYSQTPLYFASQRNKAKVVQFLLYIGANKNYKASYDVSILWNYEFSQNNSNNHNF